MPPAFSGLLILFGKSEGCNCSGCSGVLLSSKHAGPVQVFYRFKKSFVGRHGSTLRAEGSPEGGWATAAAGWCGRQCAWVTWQIVMSKAQLSTSFNVSPQ